MTAIERYLSFISLPWLIFGVIVAMALSIFVPGHRRLQLSLMLLPPLLTIAIMPRLDVAAATAKALVPVGFAAVLIAAVLHPGPRRHLSPLVLLYVFTALVSFAYVVTTEDVAYALVLRLQWLLLVLGSLMALRTVVDQVSVEYLLRGLGYGLAVSVVICFAALPVEAGRAFETFGRFEPWGGNPLQTGLVYTAAAPIFFYFALRSERPAARPIWLSFGVLTLCLVIIGVSRSISVMTIICLSPLLISLTRRPVLMIFALLALLIGSSWFLSQSKNLPFDRLLSLEDERWSLISSYYEVVSERPMFGLLGTRNMSVMTDTGMRTYSHNAYVQQLFIGGLSLFVPLAVMIVASLLAAWKVFRNRRSAPFDPLLLSIFFAMLVAMYLHGFADVQLYFPAYVWTWLHVFISSFFLTLAAEASTWGVAAEPVDAFALDAPTEYDESVLVGSAAGSFPTRR